MDLREKLLAIQHELKVPKGRTNRFGGYTYRSAEDILTAVKPLLKKHNTVLTITDTLEQIGERYYVKATATLADVKSDQYISVDGYGRETQERQKYDESQLTGAASSYARKYALNGLFLIDDSSDADSYEDDPEELDRQEAEEQQEEAPVRKSRSKKKIEEVIEDRADHDRYYFIEENDNVILIRTGEPAPENGLEITKEQYDAASTAIATSGRNGRKKKTAKQAIEEAAFMHIPEDADEEMPFFPDEEEEEKPKTRRTRRKR